MECEEISVVYKLAELLECGEFEEFWTLRNAKRDIVDPVASFDERIRACMPSPSPSPYPYPHPHPHLHLHPHLHHLHPRVSCAVIVSVMEVTYQDVGVSHACRLLQVDDSALAAIAKEKSWTINDTISIPLNDGNMAKQQRNNDSITFQRKQHNPHPHPHPHPHHHPHPNHYVLQILLRYYRLSSEMHNWICGLKYILIQYFHLHLHLQ